MALNKIVIRSDEVTCRPCITRDRDGLLYRVSFDQMCMTFQTSSCKLQEAFEGLLGIGTGHKTHSRGVDGTMYPFRIWVCDHTKYGWSRIQFPGEEKSFTAVSNVVASISARHKMQSVELSFDFKTNCASKDDVLVPLRQLALHVVPKNRNRARFVDYQGKKIEVCRDGAINGLHTIYINSLDEKKSTKEKRVPAKHRSKTTKLYSKKIDAVWFVRCEMTLFRNACKKVLPYLPNTWDQLCDICNRIDFSDFWRLIEVDQEAFRKRSLELAKRKLPKKVRLYTLLNKIGGAPALNQIICMKKIATVLQSKHLDRQIFTFCHELHLEDVFEKTLADENRYW